MKAAALVGPYKIIDTAEGLDNIGIISISELREKLSVLEEKYGPGVILNFDAGYSNVGVYRVEMVKKQPSRAK